MKNILTVSGIRPDFIRMSKVFKRLDEDSNINHTLIHTGQHYDNLLSGVFFNDLNIRKPDYDLRIGKQTHTHYVQQGVLANSLISIIENDKLNPDLILFLGDSNSVLASIPLKKEGYVIGHIEAGMRSYDERMLEEINRKACDHVSSLLFVYHEDYKNNILKENISEDRIHVTGNTIIEPLRDIADFDYTGNKEHILLDIHRPENFKYEDRLRAIIDYGNYCCDRTNTPVKLLHFSRTLSYIKKFNIDLGKIQLTSLMGYKNFIKFMQDSLFIISDSGTAQEEPGLLGVPVVVPRDFTERPQSVDNGCSIMLPVEDKNEWDNSINWINSEPNLNTNWLGDGNASYKILDIIKQKI
jgi:UDP-N-acetylglucosamine 2-epimerase (non-hydrolysing)